MEKYGKLPLGVIIIIYTETNRTYRAVHHKVGHSCKINLLDLLFNFCMLGIVLCYRLQGFEHVSFQPEINVSAERKYISPSACHVIEGSEVLEQ